MSRDDLVASALVLSFALLVTAHVALVVGLATRPPRWRALVALFAAPLALYWGYKEGMRGRGAIWIVSAAAYGVMRILASR